ncbi:MAG: AAA family ATPase [Defluviicoccus sp.]|nr:AAA family ATPase [Defluviicoccus sp.]MDE0384305.1 AAA family ATPase [Defluviicoccus sp.]
MTDSFIPFDDMRRRLEGAIAGLGAEAVPDGIGRLYLVRDLFGRVRISASDAFEENRHVRSALERLAAALSEALGARGYPADEGVLFVGDGLLETLDDTAQEIRSRVFLADRLVTGRGWWTVGEADEDAARSRITLYSVKGGVGRSTTAAVLAWHLSRKGERVLAVDMDLESPGLSSAMLETERRPKFGLADWFVEDLVGQGDLVVDDMLAAPAWAQIFEGDVRVAPAHGRDPGEYLAKLGRVYMDTADESWTGRLERVLTTLESSFRPTVVLLESRNGLHDIAAASVTDLNAEVLLFATDSESTWTDYGILFRHWRERDLAERIRERVSVVSALTPVPDREEYVRSFRAQAWDLFRDHLFDEVDATGDPVGDFSFDLDEKNAPHDPLEIGWNLGFAAGASLQDLDEETIDSAYGKFLKSFDERVHVSGEEDEP